jgi:uncharacterized MAPEG superfamily protein
MILAFWFVLIAGILPLVAIAPVKIHPDYDNALPREQYKSASGLHARALAAHFNSLEAFPFFAAGVFVAFLGAAPASWINLLAGLFVAARAAYVAAYLLDRPRLRTAVWALGFLISAALYVLPVLA